jgi:RHS repeat-associated protein
VIFLSPLIWNPRNQLAGFGGPNLSASFVYDGVGRREKKTINGSLTEFLYDGVNPVQETAGATILANILGGLGIDEPLTRTDVQAGTTSHLLSDALGSIIAATDVSGTVQTEYSYEPFGKTTVTGMSDSNSFQYTGRDNDGTGLYYYRARYYHPSLERFISEDPVRLKGGDINFYGYVNNNPLIQVDPLGLWKVPSPNDLVNDAIGYWTEFAGGAGDLYRNYRDMRSAWWKGADKYFHCKGNCQAAQRGPGGQDASCAISNGREWWDQNIKSLWNPASNAADSATDQVANRYGRAGGSDYPGKPCEQICAPFRPSGLPAQY